MRLIDADALKVNFEANTPLFAQDLVPGICAIIDRARTIDAVPVRKGNWSDGWRSKHDGTRYWYRECSECGYERDDDDAEKDTNYCPNCGARMDGETCNNTEEKLQ